MTDVSEGTGPCGLPELVTYTEAARLLGVTEKTVKNMAGDGRLDRRKLGESAQSPARITMRSILALTQSTYDTQQVKDEG